MMKSLKKSPMQSQSSGSTEHKDILFQSLDLQKLSPEKQIKSFLCLG